MYRRALPASPAVGEGSGRVRLRVCAPVGEESHEWSDPALPDERRVPAREELLLLQPHGDTHDLPVDAAVDKRALEFTFLRLCALRNRYFSRMRAATFARF